MAWTFENLSAVSEGKEFDLCTIRLPLPCRRGLLLCCSLWLCDDFVFVFSSRALFSSGRSSVSLCLCQFLSLFIETRQSSIWKTVVELT